MTIQHYIGIMSGTSMDGADAVLIRMQDAVWLSADAHAFVPYPAELRAELLALQAIGSNELHRSQVLAQRLGRLYATVVKQLLSDTGMTAADICAIGCHGQTIRHAPQDGYSIQLADLALLAEETGIFTIGDFRSRDLAAGGQGAPLVPAFHEALFKHPQHSRVLLNIGGIANISVLPPDAPAFGFDTGPGNMLMDAWMQHIWQQPYDRNGEHARQGRSLPNLLDTMLSHPYFTLPHPKSTGRELFSLDWLQTLLQGTEQPHDVLRTLIDFTAHSIALSIKQTAPAAQAIFVCGGGIRNTLLMETLQAATGLSLHSTAELNLDPQWMEAAAFGWLAACWINKQPSNPHHATGASRPLILGAGHYA